MKDEFRCDEEQLAGGYTKIALAMGTSAEITIVHPEKRQEAKRARALVAPFDELLQPAEEFGRRSPCG
jgi:hypothetical protein